MRAGVTPCSSKTIICKKIPVVPLCCLCRAATIRRRLRQTASSALVLIPFGGAGYCRCRPGILSRPVLMPLKLPETQSWPVECWQRLKSDFWLKGVGISLFMTLFFIAYLHLLKNPSGETFVMPLTMIDHWVGFNPWGLPFYLSLWIYTSLAPGLIAQRGDLVRYGAAIGVVCLSGLACFYFFPTAVPANDLVWSGSASFEFLKKVDSAGNAFPSLHVASAVFSGVWIDRELRAMQAARWSLAANVLWGAAIVFSTLMTKQHVALDVLGGLVLGGVGVWASLRWIRPRRPALISAR